jgi:hypothetical protein
MGRLLGHLDARRSVRLEAQRGAGATALLRALCAEPPRPGTPDGTIALPVGLPASDGAAAAALLVPDATTPLAHREMLVLLDDRDLTGDDLALLRQQLPRCLLVVTGRPEADTDDLASVGVSGLSQHHAVGLVEAAMGRALSLEEGRAARAVATAVDGLPATLVQAAAAVRDGGLTFDDVLDVLDDPPRPQALAAALHDALDDDLHVTLSHLRALGDVPVTTSVAAAACGLDRDQATRTLRRLARLGLVLTDGRDGWTSASGIPAVSEPVRAGAADRVAQWLGSASDPLSVFDAASVLAAVADRVEAGDHPITLALSQAALARLPLDGLDATRALLQGAAEWAEPEPGSRVAAVGASIPPTPDAESDSTAAAVDGHDETADTGDAVDDVAAPVEGAPTDDAAQRVAPDTRPAEPGALAALLGDRRRLALIAVASAAVIAAMLLVVPSLRENTQPEVIRGEVDLGVASVGEATSGALTLDLTDRDAVPPLTLVLDGPDTDAFVVDPARCDTLDCRASITFTPDRAGTHVGTVTVLDAGEVEHAVVDLTGSGTGDPPQTQASTNLAVTLFPTEPTPIPAGGSAVLPVGVRNNGPDDSTGARVLVTVPSGVSVQSPGCTVDAEVLTCPLAELPAGASERLTVTLSLPTTIDEVRVTAEVSPVTDVDEAGSDNAAGFTYPVAAPATEEPPA